MQVLILCRKTDRNDVSSLRFGPVNTRYLELRSVGCIDATGNLLCCKVWMAEAAYNERQQILVQEQENSHGIRRIYFPHRSYSMRKTTFDRHVTISQRFFPSTGCALPHAQYPSEKEKQNISFSREPLGIKYCCQGCRETKTCSLISNILENGGRVGTSMVVQSTSPSRR